MEKTVEKNLEEICRVPGVIGALCVDQHGLVLTSTARGQVSSSAAGPISSLAKQSLALHPQSFSAPVIVVESQNGKTLIKQEEGFTSAIFKA